MWVYRPVTAFGVTLVSVFRTQLGQERVRLWLVSDPAVAKTPWDSTITSPCSTHFLLISPSIGDTTYLCQNLKLGAFKQHFS